MNKKLQQMFNQGQADYNKRVRAAAQQALPNQLGTLVDVSQIGDQMSTLQVIDMIKKQGLLPIQSAPKANVETVITKEMFGLLEYSGDLMALGVIEPKEYMKLKKLIKSGDTENLVMVSKILNAKIDKDVERKTNQQ